MERITALDASLLFCEIFESIAVVFSCKLLERESKTSEFGRHSFRPNTLKLDRFVVMRHVRLARIRGYVRLVRSVSLVGFVHN